MNRIDGLWRNFVDGPVRTKRVLKYRVKRRIVPRGAPEESEQLAKNLLLPHPKHSQISARWKSARKIRTFVGDNPSRLGQ